MSYLTVAAPKGKVEALPKWAQEYIALLQANTERAYAVAADGPPDSDTFLDPYGHIRPLGKGTKVKFQVGERYDEYVEARVMDGGRVQVRCGRQLAIQPTASNVIEVRPLTDGD